MFLVNAESRGSVHTQVLIAKQPHGSNLRKKCVCLCVLLRVRGTWHCVGLCSQAFSYLILCRLWFLRALWSKVGHKNTETHEHTRLSLKCQLSSSSVSSSVSHQATRSPTAWTAGTLSAGPPWRWAPTLDSSPSQDFPLSRPTCSDSLLAPPWAGAKNRKPWLLPLSAEVKDTHIPLSFTWYLVYYHICFCSNADVNHY